MFKIWAKIITREKIIRTLMYKGYGDFECKKLHFYLSEICSELDIPTPVVLNSHIVNFNSFKTTRFLSSDFVENVNFDKLTLEYVNDNGGEKHHLYKSYLPAD